MTDHVPAHWHESALQTIAAKDAEIERRRTELAQEIDAHDMTRAEVERLRTAIAYMNEHADSPTIIRREARRALEPKP